MYSIYVVFIASSEFGGKTLRRTSLTTTLNVRTVNVILLMLNTAVRVFLSNPVTKRCQRCRAMNIPFTRNKQKTRRKKEGGKLTTTNNNNYNLFSSNIFIEFITNAAPPASNSVYPQNLTEIIL